MFVKPIRKRSVVMDVVIPNHPTLRQMLRKYLETGEVSDLLTKVSDSYDFSDESQIDMDADLKRSADISDFIKRSEAPTAVPADAPTPSEKQTVVSDSKPSEAPSNDKPSDG